MRGILNQSVTSTIWAVSIGRLRPCPLLDWKFVILSHNTVRGAAGGTILIAELLASTMSHRFRAMCESISEKA